VAGGKGGVGKTTLAVNLAILLARAGQRTLRVGLDPGLGNVDVHLRLAPRWTVADVAEQRCRAAQAWLAGPAGIRVLAGARGTSRLSAHDPAVIAGLHDALADAGRDADVVVCDCGAGIGPAVIETACRADLVLAITTPEPAAVTDAYALCKILAQRDRPAPRLVVNRARSREDAMRTVARLASASRRFLGRTAPLAGWVHADRAIERAVLAQSPLAIGGAGTAFDDLQALAAAVLSALPPRRPECVRFPE
jgi:flagellar biosynthesis protein FlhG